MSEKTYDQERLSAIDFAHLWHPFTQQQAWTQEELAIIVAAEGCTLIDATGKRYVDGVSSLWTNVHGHRHPRLDAALRAQLDRVAHSTLLGLSHPPAIELAGRLANIAPWGLERVFYSDNGSTAVEVALKMAFQLQQQRGETQRTRFASLRDAYHGDTIGAVSVGAIETFHAVYRPLLFGGVALPAPVTPGGDEQADCLARALALLDEHGHTLAAFVFEPLVQGAAGMKMHDVDYLKPLLERARELGVLLVADEVAVGFGRTGSMFAMEQVGISPDFLCLAKGLSAGYLPLAATLTTQAVYEGFLAEPAALKQLFHGHTFTGNPLACAVAIESLDLFEEERTLEQAKGLALRLANGIETQIAEHPCVAAVRQRGLMIGIDLAKPDGQPFSREQRVGHHVCMAARTHGVILRPLGDTIVINPPLVLGDADTATLLTGLRAAIDEVLGEGGWRLP